MIRSLMKQEVKANYKLYVIFLSIIAMYAVTLVAMYDPSLKDSLKSLEESMEQGAKNSSVTLGYSGAW